MGVCALAIDDCLPADVCACRAELAGADRLYVLFEDDVIVMPRLNPVISVEHNGVRVLWSTLPLVIHTPACYPPA